MSAPPSDAGFFDGSGATGAGLAFAAEDIGEGQVFAGLTFGVDIVTVGAAAFGNGEFEDGYQSGVDILDVCVG